MASCEPNIYAGVTPAMLDCLSQSIQAAFGLTLEGDEGTAAAMGTTLSWEYQRASQQLTITCTQKPMFLSCDTIYAHLGSMLKKCRE